MLSKGEPITTNDIKSLRLKNHNYFSLREQGYFILARAITHHAKLNNQSKAQG